jgi:hypothetical protein
MNRKIIITVLTVLLLLGFASVTSAQNYASQDDMLRMKKEMDGMRGLLGELKELVKQQNSMIKDLEQNQAEDNKSNEKGAAISLDIHEGDEDDHVAETAGKDHDDDKDDHDLEGIISKIKPQIEIAGDFVANLSDDDDLSTEEDRFSLRGVDIVFSGEIDGVGQGYINLAYHDDDVSLEEGYLDIYDLLPFGTDVRLGKFRVSYGLLNTSHPHALPQVDYPAIYRAYFGDEGYIDEGVGIAGSFPSLWGSDFDYTLQVLNGNRHEHDEEGHEEEEHDEEYGGLKDYDDLVYAAKLNNTIKPSENMNIRWGLSALTGRFEADNDSPRFYYQGADLTFKYSPFEEKYKVIRWQTEVITSQIEAGSSWERTYGLYSFIDYKFVPKWLVGGRYDYLELPMYSSDHLTELSAYLTHEYTKNIQIRLQFKNTDRNYDKETNEIFLQWIFILGQHEHL